MENDLYKTDIIEWSRQQAEKLRKGDLGNLDIEHLADEIEAVGKAEIREFERRTTTLLKFMVSQEIRHDLMPNSSVIRIIRHSLMYKIERTPSLRAVIADPDFLTFAWSDAVVALIEDNEIKPPERCPWTIGEIFDL